MRATCEPVAADAVRLDVWLWAARFFKTRALAKQAILGGKVALNAQPGKPAKTVRVGYHVDIRRGEERFEVAVLGLSAQRGPAPLAQQLYAESAESQARRAAEREARRLSGAGLAHPPRKPDKKARRQLQAAKLPPWFPQ